MSHIIHLKKSDKALILEALAASMEFKYKKLRNPESIEQMEHNYADFATKIVELPVEIHNKQNNMMTWYIDQMKHSGLFWDTKLCRQACDLAQQVINNSYGHYSKIEVFEDLFKDQ
jgi:hypothetical protein